MARAFSTTARALLQFIWRGTQSLPEYETTIKSSVSKNPKLQDADKVEIDGQEHSSPADPEMHVSGKVFKGNVRLTSLHAYHDGRVVYSKEDINKAQQ